MDRLDVPNLLFDALFYLAKHAPKRAASQKWPLGASLGATSAVAFASPRSVQSAIEEFCSHAGKRASMPLVRPVAIRFDLVATAWDQALRELKGMPDGGVVPVSTVEHETTQLQWGRTGVPECVAGCECEAKAMESAPAPLHVYLSASEQAAFDTHGDLPDQPRFCLLCIRRDAHALAMLQASLPDTLHHSGRAAFVRPPFLNLVDVPGGYRSSAFCSPIELSRVVALSGQTRVLFCPLRNLWYVDQGGLVFGAPLNGPAAVF